MTLLDGPDGPLEVLVTGSGAPTTVFAHGVAGSIAETRPFGSAVVGTRVFFHFRGHGLSARPDSPWSYPGLAAELMAVRDAHAARRALGVSLGAGALLHAATERPDLFDPDVRRVIRAVPLMHPLRDSAALAAVECPVLVIGQLDDNAHPSSVAADLAEALPDGRVEILSPGGVLWTHRIAVRKLIAEFLNT